MSNFINTVSNEIKKCVPSIEAVYRDLHQHPELSRQEKRTSGVIADHLRQLGFDVTEHVGGYGVVGLMKNGEGATVMLRADMDALPMKEMSGVPYMSHVEVINSQEKVAPVAHTCGHDMHMSCLLGAATVMAQTRELWQGSLLLVFQPDEETGDGSKGMIQDGLIEKFPRPDVIFGQHVMPSRAGTVGWKKGQVLTAGDSWQVTFFGKGGHGGVPQQSIDPVVMAASAVVRLQSIVAREVSPQAHAVITIGEFHAGSAENIIPSQAYIRLNVRTTDEQVRDHVLAAIRRICIAEAQASHAPREPLFEEINSYPLTVNDDAVSEKVARAFIQHFGNNVFETPAQGASEDFSRYGRAWKTPYMYWFVGGSDQDTYDEAVAQGKQGQLPGPHSPFWAPAIQPTLRTGMETMLIAAGLWLDREQ
ncbi:MAG: amidohydrolase [Megasphaera sp.]|jgi:hippurate hydrolase|nr:amidohydrolase [Megasphaera sp.]MCI1247983.1 amidohydrolase [Megasphaera sp.]